MRTRVYSVCLSSLFTLSLLALTSCDVLTTFYVDVTAETTVERNALSLIDFSALGFNNFASFDVSSSSEFENEGATKNNIGESYVTGFVLEVTSPDGATMEFIDELEIFMGQGDSDQRTRVAYLPADADTIVKTLFLVAHDDRDISQYLRADSTVVEVKAKGESPQQDTTLEATMTFEIKLNL